MQPSTKVSVIVPVYNVKDYLDQCLRSIIAQTLKEIEVILVDDGSTDGSETICDRYGKTDTRFKVIHKKKGGLSSARNTGLTIAEADYVMFVDGDDWVEPQFCELPYYAALNNNADVVMFLYNKINDGISSAVSVETKKGIISEGEALYLNTRYLIASWTGFYKRTLFDQLRFPNGKYYEDIGFSHKLLHEAKTIYFHSAQLYNYRMNRPGSITTALNTRDHSDKREMALIRLRDLEDWGYNDCAVLCAFSMLIMYGTLRDDQKPFVEKVRELKGTIPDCFNWKQKIMLSMFRISPPLFDWICRITGKRIA